MRFPLIALAVLALAGCSKPPEKPSANHAEAPAPAGPVKGVDRSHKGAPFPDVEFGDNDGTQTSFEGFEGIPTVVNLWATWCVPCVKELPTLSKLADARKVGLWVVPISQDTAPRASVDAFLERIGLGKFDVYYDPKMAVSGATGAEVLPTTILYDVQGREVWRYVGDLDWTGAEAARLLAEADATPR
jgi:thiol-disulfide isomerase/thioredoxin